MNPRIPTALALSTALLLGWMDQRVRAGATDGTLDLYWIDSMGGGSTLAVTPSGESILIDSGNPGGRDAGRIHRVATEVAGLKRIDHLITTHLHIDHFGGAAELSQRMPIGEVHDNGIPDRDPDGGNDAAWPLKIRAYREMSVAARSIVRPGDSMTLRQRDNSPPVMLRFVAAKQRYALPTDPHRPDACKDADPRPVDRSDNANSIVLVLQFGGFRFFDGGDLTWNAEAGLVCPVRQVGTVDVYQVNHHGLDISNNPLLLAALAPTVAVFNNGPRKGGMPGPAASLRSLPSVQAIYQVHRNQIAPEANAPAEFCANATEGGGEFIHLRVAPDARTYTVTVPSTGHRATYPTRL